MRMPKLQVIYWGMHALPPHSELTRAIRCKQQCESIHVRQPAVLPVGFVFLDGRPSVASVYQGGLLGGGRSFTVTGWVTADATTVDI